MPNSREYTEKERFCLWICVEEAVYWRHNRNHHAMALYIPKNGPRPAPIGSSHLGAQPESGGLRSSGPRRITGREIDRLEDTLRPHLGHQNREAVTEAIEGYMNEHHIGERQGINSHQVEALIDDLGDKRRDLGLGESQLGHVEDALKDALDR